MTDADFIPDDQFVPDPEPKQTPVAPDFVPDEQFKEDKVPIKSSSSPDFVPDDEFVEDENKYSTPGQQAMTALEGVGRGATFGLTDALASGMRKGATSLGVPEEYLHYVAPASEDIAGRKEANPIESGASEIAGNVGSMMNLPQIGSKAIDGMIKMGLISGGDELSKAMLGQGDPNEAVASHIAESGAIGLLGGALFGKAEQLGSKGLQALENSKIGNKLPSFISGFGHAAQFPGPIASLSEINSSELEKLNDPMFKLGQKAFHALSGSAAKNIATTISSLEGYQFLGPFGGVAAPIIEKSLEKVIGPNLSKAAQKTVGPAVLKMAASGNVKNLSDIIDHATNIGKGASKISNGIESIFNASANKAIDSSVSDKEREKLKKFIEEGGVAKQIQDESQQPQQGFAEGGTVQSFSPQQNPVAEVYPEQNNLMAASKARVSNYLNSVRPLSNSSKLPFDSEHKDPLAEREYNKKLDLAINPLSILKHVQDGTLVPKQVADFNAMYPDLHQHLSKKITERMMHAQLKEEKRPKYKTRQALSLFLGTSLDSTLTPQGMMAAQSVFVKQKSQQQPQSKSSALSKVGSQSQTAEQARTARLNKS